MQILFAPQGRGGGYMPVRVLLVDDHGVVRQGLRMYLALDSQIEVVGEGLESLIPDSYEAPPGKIEDVSPFDTIKIV